MIVVSKIVYLFPVDQNHLIRVLLPQELGVSSLADQFYYPTLFIGQVLWWSAPHCIVISSSESDDILDDTIDSDKKH